MCRCMLFVVCLIGARRCYVVSCCRLSLAVVVDAANVCGCSLFVVAVAVVCRVLFVD